ncbi:MAG: threonine synthase, partial [Acidobacteria bacterium]|nr:threonine synthase [Acidobacteriota bacterium]
DMRLISTNHGSPEVNFRDALLQGLAPDGGLYLPATLPVFDARDLAAWRDLPFDDLAARLASRLLEGEFAPDVIKRLVRDALNFPVPVRFVGDGLWILELFHGPTLAFKDFGARFLARFFGHLVAERGEHATILVATSGDTGSAVARGFAGVAGVRVVVLYPAGKVSPFQESQMATIGGNVTAVRVPGVFDDCQRLVKAAFLNPSLAPLRLSSANSINIGRLLPQSFYYVFSCLRVAGHAGAPVVFSVPSGNLGNLTAGVIAARMGLPGARFIAAANVNDVLPEYLRTGTYRSRPSVATVSNAMDVGDPSNFTRLAALYDGSLDAVRHAIMGERVSEDDTRATIREAYAAHGLVLDPHAAVAWAAARRRRSGIDASIPVVCLATAHPAKFGATITEELGFEPELPPVERDCRRRPIRATDLPDLEPATFFDLLCNLPPVPAGAIHARGSAGWTPGRPRPRHR